MKTLNREQAIDHIRAAVLKLVDDDHSMCEVAARLGIFCRGFRRLGDDELTRRYQWLADRRGVEDRASIEDLANRWQLARQLATHEALACDVQTREHDACDGWASFTEAELERFHLELCDEAIAVT